jgi:hypothetical protein
MLANKIKRSLLIVLVAFSFCGQAQNSCVQNLRNARNAYEEGKLQELPNLLLKCIDDGFSKEEKVEALRLLTLSYLFNEEQQNAEETYLQLLHIDPEYEINLDSDPTELVILAENYDTDPKFFYGFKGGASYGIMQSEFEVVHNRVSQGKYDFPLGLAGGIFFQYPVNEIFSINLETLYNFRTTVLNRPILSTESTSFQNIEETQQWIEVPLLLNYKLPWVNSFLLEATGGPSLQYLFSSNLNVQGLGAELNNFDMLAYRNQINMNGILGLRANFKKLGANFITVELLFQYRVLNEVNQEAMPEEVRVDLATNRAYADFNYKGHALWLRAGLRFPYFKPELIK